METWPSSLVIRRDGFKESPPSRQLRSSMDVGEDKVRKRSSRAVRKVTVQMLLTDSLVDTFDDFYLANDDLAFSFSHPRTNESVVARFTSDSPSYEPNETMWNVIVNLEILP
jgi:hypothetical protein